MMNQPEQPLANHPLRCPKCDYRLTGLAESRCPECGGEFDERELRRGAAAYRPPSTLGLVVLLLLVPGFVAAIWVLLGAMVAAGELAGKLAVPVFYGSLVATFMTRRRRFSTDAMHRPSAMSTALLFFSAATAQFAVILLISSVAYGEFRRLGLPIPAW